MWVLAHAALMAVAACGSGENEADALSVCSDERQRQSQCINDAAFQECVSCRQKCGRNCLQNTPQTCPVQYHCR